MATKIHGGYYLKARCIQNSKISIAPPHVREIWDWFLKEANHKDTEVCKRGQCIRTYSDIQNGLKWFVGYRKMMYKKHKCENATKWLRKAGMIATMKTTRGILVTICNYDKYQNSSNYDCYTKDCTRATMKPQCTATINKNDKNEKKERTKEKKNKKRESGKNVPLGKNDNGNLILPENNSYGNKYSNQETSSSSSCRNGYSPDDKIVTRNPLGGEMQITIGKFFEMVVERYPGNFTINDRNPLAQFLKNNPEYPFLGALDREKAKAKYEKRAKSNIGTILINLPDQLQVNQWVGRKSERSSM